MGSLRRSTRRQRDDSARDDGHGGRKPRDRQHVLVVASVTLIRVAGGTGAGTRTIRPTATAWVHVCRDKPTDGGVLLEACFARCPVCGTKRPLGTAS